MCPKVKAKLRETMYKLETFTRRHIRKKEVKERSRDKERKPGLIGWFLAPGHVHYYRKLFRRFMFVLGTILFGTGAVLLVLTYTPTASYEGGKTSGPVLIVLGLVLGVVAALWMVYKKDVKKTRKDAYRSQQKEEERNNNNNPPLRLGNQDYNHRLSDFISYNVGKSALDITEHYGDVQVNRVLELKKNRRLRHMNQTVGTNDVQIDLPDIQVQRAEEDWRLALAIAEADEREEHMAQDDQAGTSQVNGQINASYTNNDDEDDDECSDSDLEPVHMNPMYSKTKHQLQVPDHPATYGKKGGPVKKNRHTQEVVVEHHNLDMRDKGTVQVNDWTGEASGDSNIKSENTEPNNQQNLSKANVIKNNKERSNDPQVKSNDLQVKSNDPQVKSNDLQVKSNDLQVKSNDLPPIKPQHLSTVDDGSTPVNHSKVLDPIGKKSGKPLPPAMAVNDPIAKKSGKPLPPAITVNEDFVKNKGKKKKPKPGQSSRTGVQNIGYSTGESINTTTNKGYSTGESIINTTSENSGNEEPQEYYSSSNVKDKSDMVTLDLDSDLDTEIEDIETLHIENKKLNRNKLSSNYRSPSPNITLRGVSSKPAVGYPESPKVGSQSLSPRPASRSASPYHMQSYNLSRDSSFNTKTDVYQNGLSSLSQDGIEKVSHKTSSQNGSAVKSNKHSSVSNGVILRVQNE